MNVAIIIASIAILGLVSFILFLTLGQSIEENQTMHNAVSIMEEELERKLTVEERGKAIVWWSSGFEKAYYNGAHEQLEEYKKELQKK